MSSQNFSNFQKIYIAFILAFKNLIAGFTATCCYSQLPDVSDKECKEFCPIHIMCSVMCIVSLIVTYLNSKFIPFILQKKRGQCAKTKHMKVVLKVQMFAHFRTQCTGQKGAVIN